MLKSIRFLTFFGKNIKIFKSRVFLGIFVVFFWGFGGDVFVAVLFWQYFLGGVRGDWKWWDLEDFGAFLWRLDL